MDKIETELGRSFFIAGDVVVHNACRYGWQTMLALDEDENGNVYPMIWPHPSPPWKACDCRMVQGSRPGARLSLLTTFSKRMDENEADYQPIAARQLEALRGESQGEIGDQFADASKKVEGGSDAHR